MGFQTCLGVILVLALVLCGFSYYTETVVCPKTCKGLVLRCELTRTVCLAKGKVEVIDHD